MIDTIEVILGESQIWFSGCFASQSVRRAAGGQGGGRGASGGGREQLGDSNSSLSTLGSWQRWDLSRN